MILTPLSVTLCSLSAIRYTDSVFIGSKSLYCIQFWGLWKGFSVITSPNWNGFGWNLEYISVGPQCVVALKIFREIAPGVPPNGAKAHFIIFRYESNVPFRTLNSSLILAIFVATDVNRCASAYVCENFWNFCVGVLQAQKPAPRGGNFVSLLSSYSMNSTISGDRRIRKCQLGILCAGFWTRFYCSFCLLLCTLVSNHWQSYRLCSVLTQLQLVDFFTRWPLHVLA